MGGCVLEEGVSVCISVRVNITNHNWEAPSLNEGHKPILNLK